MRTFTKIAIASASLLSIPALAQSQMPHDGTTPSTQEPSTATAPMSATDRAEMTRCDALPAGRAAKDARCIALMKDQPAPMKEGGADNHNGTPSGAKPN